jgi:hypothetical protein
MDFPLTAAVPLNMDLKLDDKGFFMRSGLPRFNLWNFQRLKALTIHGILIFQLAKT